MSRRIRMVMIIIMSFILFGITSFILLAKFYPPLNRSLFGGKFSISQDEIQFWVNKVPERSYYRVRAKYLRDLDPDNLMQWGGHTVFFADTKEVLGFDAIFFNPEDNKIYGGGSEENIKEWKWAFYSLGEGRIDDGVFKAIFPKDTKFTFRVGGSLDISSAPAYYIKIYFRSMLKKLEREDLQKGTLAEIVENEDPTKRKARKK